MDNKLTRANSLFEQNSKEEMKKAKKLVGKFQKAIDESGVDLDVAIKSLIGGLQSYIDFWDIGARRGIEEAGAKGTELAQSMYELHIAQYSQIISLLMYRNNPQNAMEILARCMEFETARLNALEAPAPEEDENKQSEDSTE
jgi:hypothetical protein